MAGVKKQTLTGAFLPRSPDVFGRPADCYRSSAKPTSGNSAGLAGCERVGDCRRIEDLIYIQTLLLCENLIIDIWPLVDNPNLGAGDYLGLLYDPLSRSAYRDQIPLLQARGVDVAYDEPGEIRGSKWHDLNGDGNWDAGEPALADWRIYVDANDNAKFDEGEYFEWTGADGSYVLTYLRPTTYVVREEFPADWERSVPADGSYTVALGAGQIVEGRNFASNDLPTVTTPLADVTVNEDAAATVLSLGPVFYDAAALTYVVAGNTAPALLTANVSDGDLTLTYLPNQFGTSDITVRATDAAGAYVEDTFTVTVNPVNDAPIANEQLAQTDEDTAVAVTLSSSDIEDDPLTFSIVTGPAHGTLSGTAPSLTYTPHANYSGPDSFTFNANDGTLDSNVATVSITVNPVNDVSMANAQSVTTDEDTALAITLTGDDGDPEVSQVLTFALATSPSHGTLTGFNASTGQVTYTPGADYNGSDSFTFKVTDDNTAGGAGLTGAEATVSASTRQNYLRSLQGRDCIPSLCGIIRVQCKGWDDRPRRSRERSADWDYPSDTRVH